MLRRAFDLGITHFDLANNYGPPPGSAETAFGEILRDRLRAAIATSSIISTKAGYLMWPGPYGEWGSRKYLLASLDQSLRRMGLDYVDIFYSHRFDPDTPLEETMGALDQAVRSGKALYAGISSYNRPSGRAEAAAILRELGTPCLIHQPSYSMLNRWVEETACSTRWSSEGIGCIVFSPLAQGMLTDKYLERHPRRTRRAAARQVAAARLPERRDNLASIRGAQRHRRAAAARRWRRWRWPGCCEDPRVTSALIGASRPEQIEDCVGALNNLDFTPEELAEIDRHARGRRRQPVEPVAAGVSGGGTMAGTSRAGTVAGRQPRLP